jgi:hypothetical protein
MGNKRKAPSFDPEQVWNDLKRDGFSTKKVAQLGKVDIE